jgi:uncharacterized membrane protein SpoIIM required for sporulation
MKTKSERFVEEKRAQWRKLRNMLEAMKKSYKELSEEEMHEFPRLYRLLCADLAEARMLKLSPDVLNYLNNLVGQAHRFLYSFPPVTSVQVMRFIRKDLPATLLINWRFVLASALFFFISFFVSYFVIYRNPQLAHLVMPQQVLDSMEASYSAEIQHDSNVGMGTAAASFYIQHNISIAFCSFAAGVLIGIGTIFFLVYNGIALGTIAGYINALGYGANFWAFVTAHSVMELTGLVIAGAAGLLLGYSILSGNRYYRKDWLKIQKNNILTLLAPCVFLLAIAAIIEGNISPSPLPYTVKAAVAICSLVGLLFYFVFIPMSGSKEDMV